jgi:FkbM family methyltransferase
MMLPNGLRVFGLNGFETRFLYGEIFERRRYFGPGISLHPCDIVFDVGANIGIASLFFAQQEPGIQIYAIEPAPLAFDALLRNARRHRLRLRAFQCAAGAREEERVLTYLPNHSICSGFHPRLQIAERRMRASLEGGDSWPSREAEGFSRHLFSSARQEACSVVTLSKLITDHAVPEIGLLKIDVEGHEQAVLDGVAEHHWPLIRQVVVEVHGGRHACALVGQRLKERGFDVTIGQDTNLQGTPLWDVSAWRSE